MPKPTTPAPTTATAGSSTESAPATVEVTVSPPPPPCAGGLREDCLVSTRAGKGRIRLEDAEDAEDDALSWKWLLGEETTLADFGSPATETPYELCVFDADGVAVAYTTYGPDDDCDGASCWRTKKNGFQYQHRADGEDGATSTSKLALRAGADGKAKITASVEGGLLSVGGLPPAAPVTVQLRAEGAGCWEATFSAPANSSDSDSFADTAD
jgi:hypothetical protein